MKKGVKSDELLLTYTKLKCVVQRSPLVRCTEQETPFSNAGVAPEGAACIDESRRADSSSSSLRRSSLTVDGGGNRTEILVPR